MRKCGHIRIRTCLFQNRFRLVHLTILLNFYYYGIITMPKVTPANTIKKLHNNIGMG